jgi:hypothetical protein
MNATIILVVLTALVLTVTGCLTSPGGGDGTTGQAVSCIDSDTGADNYFERGIVQLEDASGNALCSATDTCIDSYTLIEFYCTEEGSYATRPPYACPTGTECRDGRCAQKTGGVLKPRYDCEGEDEYTMAFLLVESAEHPATDEFIETMDSIKDETARLFSLATRTFAALDTRSDVVVVTLDTDASAENMATAFYEQHEDMYDFLTVFTTFPLANTPSHLIITNKIVGIGLPVFDHADEYGSERLRGMNMLGDIGQYSVEEGSAAVLRYTSHQWGVFVNYEVGGETSSSFRSQLHPNQWSLRVVGSSPLGGAVWEAAGDGTFTAHIPDTMLYNDMDLYFMGILQPEDVEPIEFIESDFDPLYIIEGFTLSGTPTTISVQQVIAVEGARYCTVPEGDEPVVTVS